MPFRSNAQKAKFAQLEKEGKLKKGTTAKWESETKGPLPDKISGPIKSIQQLKARIKTVKVK